MVTIVSDAARDKSVSSAITSRFAAYSEAITDGVGYTPAERDERRAEIEGHLADMYARVVWTGVDPDTAAARVIAEFGDPVTLSRHLWRTRMVADLRASWRLPGLACACMLADLVASTVWIGIDLASGSMSAARYASLLVVFTFATTVLYWVAMTLGYGGIIIARRAFRHRAPVVELMLACGLAGSAATVFFTLRPGAIANAVGSVMEAHALWRASWEWAGAVFPTLTLAGGAMAVWRARRTP